MAQKDRSAEEGMMGRRGPSIKRVKRLASTSNTDSEESTASERDDDADDDEHGADRDIES